MQGQWSVQEISRPAEGKTYQDCLEAIREEVDKHIDEVLKFERVLSMDKTYVMKKDDCAALPANMKSVVVGLGWDCAGDADLDASIVCLDKHKTVTETVSFSKLTAQGIKHRGDNTTGEGAGDDERVRIDLD